MWIGNRLIPRNTTITGSGRVQGERLEIEITSIECEGSIYDVELQVYDSISGDDCGNCIFGCHRFYTYRGIETTAGGRRIEQGHHISATTYQEVQASLDDFFIPENTEASQMADLQGLVAFYAVAGSIGQLHIGLTRIGAVFRKCAAEDKPQTAEE